MTRVEKCGDGVLGPGMMFFGLPKPYTLDLRQFFMFLKIEFWLNFDRKQGYYLEKTAKNSKKSISEKHKSGPEIIPEMVEKSK